MGSSRPPEQRQQTSDRPTPVSAEARERELLRVNRALATLTRATEALIRATDEQQLLNETCRIIVEVGGYAFAWVGYVQHDGEKSVWPMARCGMDDGYLAQARITWGEGARGQGPTGRAIRFGRPQIGYTDVSDKSFAPWRKAALRRGFHSNLSLPLQVDGQVIGVLNLYSAEVGSFDEDELRLMENLAQNVAYGIGMQRMQFERRRAERELKESEGRYRSLVELSPDAIVVHTQGIIIFSNSAADRLFRANTSMPLVGKRILDLTQPEDALPHLQLDSEHLPLGAVEERLSRQDGSSFFAEVTAAPIVFHGVHARQVVIRDITERKQVQDQLIQAAKLATLGEMAAGMAHELSQPINIIRMAAEGTLLMIGRGKATQEYQEKHFALIADQASRMAEIIDHIRIFSRKDAGEVVVFDACHSVRLAAELMAPQMQNANVELTVRLPDDTCPVRGRPVQLEQVIINLLSNAKDAVNEARRASKKPQSGIICVEGSLVDRATLKLTVTDNGTGIGPNHLDRVFEPFFTTKEVGSGTGLGLSVSFGIISAMEGRLEAHNTPSNGAQFVITLPLTEAPAASAEPPAAGESVVDDASSAGRHVLLVDDEPQAIETMSSYFTELGYRVSQAYSGNSAFQLFSSDPADIVVTDVRMPDGDGEQLVKKLRQHAPRLPIVVVTGHMGMTEHLEHDAASEHFAVLKKPISLAAMAETVEQLLHKD
jgi:two-component system, cell cycle sensor histidine kinase and response regulator CckA